MSLWVDKHRPRSFEELNNHEGITEQLEKMVIGETFPHLLVYGPSGAGKKTRISCILKNLFGHGVEKLKIENKQFTTPSNKKLELQIISSKYHIEITPRYVVLNQRFGHL